MSNIVTAVPIENREHFCAILLNLNTVSDFLCNIEQLCQYASAHSDLNLLRKAILLKAPLLQDAFTKYISTFYGTTYKNATGCITTSVSEIDRNPPIFLNWAVNGGFLPDLLLIEAKSGKLILPFSDYLIPVKNGKKSPRPACPKCGKPLSPKLQDDMALHECRVIVNNYKSDKKKIKSVWTCSGGGVGAGKKR